MRNDPLEGISETDDSTVTIHELAADFAIGLQDPFLLENKLRAQDEFLLSDPRLHDSVCAQAVFLDYLDPDRLNDRPVPDRIPPELAPPSMLSKSVDGILLYRYIGCGGEAIVYKGRDTTEHTNVAVKFILKPNEPGARARFLRQTRILRDLTHPSLPVFRTSGQWEGRDYAVFDFVTGIPLEGMEIACFSKERLAVIMQIIAEAMSEAHKRPVLHRDLKPSNVLIDSEQIPHILDFGLAKDPTEIEDLTQSGTVLGSPHYLAPEVAEGHRSVNWVLVDIFGIGAILYYLLTGRSPYSGHTTAELLRKAAAAEFETPRAVNPEADPDLEAICLQCMRLSPSERWQTAADVAKEFSRVIAKVPIQSRGGQFVKKARKWAREQWPLILLSITLLASLAVMFHLYNARNASDRERSRSMAKFQLQQGVDDCLDGRISEGVVRFANALRVCPEDDAEGLPNSIRQQLAAWRPVMPVLSHADASPGAIAAASDSSNGNVVSLSQRDSEEIVTIELRTSDGPPVPLQHTLDPAFEPRRISRDGQHAAFERQDGSDGSTVQLWNLRNATPGGMPFRVSGQHVSVAEVSAARPCILVSLDDPPNTYELWDGARGSRVLGPIRGHRRPYARTFSDDGLHLVIPDLAVGRMRVFDTETGRIVGEAPGTSGVVVNDGRAILVPTRDGIAVWDLTMNQVVATAPHGACPVRAFHKAASGRRVACVGENAVQVYDYDDAGMKLTPIGNPLGHEGAIRDVGFSRDETVIVTGGEDRTVRVWSVVPGRFTGILFPFLQGITPSHVIPHPREVTQVFPLSDDGTWATLADDKTVRIWRVPPKGNAAQRLDVELPYGSEAILSPLGRSLIVVEQSGELHEIALAAAEVRKRRINVNMEQSRSSLAGWPPVWTHWRDGQLTAWNPTNGEQIGSTVRTSRQVSDLRCVLDGSHPICLLVERLEHAQLKAIDIVTAEPIWIDGKPFSADCLFQVTPAGAFLAVAHPSRSGVRIDLWQKSEHSYALLRSVMQSTPVKLLQLRDRGAECEIMTADTRGTVRVWRSADENPRVLETGASSDVVVLAAATPHLALATGGTVSIFHEQDLPVIRLFHDSKVMTMAFSPDGKTLATQTERGSRFLWNAETGLPLGAQLHPVHSRLAPVFPNSREVLTIGPHGVFVQTLPTLLVGAPAALQQGLESAAGVTAEGGEVRSLSGAEWGRRARSGSRSIPLP